jgi:hypothetical protein
MSPEELPDALDTARLAKYTHGILCAHGRILPPRRCRLAQAPPISRGLLAVTPADPGSASAVLPPSTNDCP